MNTTITDLKKGCEYNDPVYSLTVGFCKPEITPVFSLSLTDS